MESGVLNNREIVVVFWLVVFAVFALSQASIRKSSGLVIKLFFSPKIFIPLLLSSLPILLVIYTANKNGLWDTTLMKETVFWAVGTGIVMFFNSTSVKDGKKLIKKSLLDSVKIIVILEFVINIYVFPIAIEFFLVPFITILVLTSTFANYQKDKKYSSTKRFLEILLAIIGIFLLLFAVSKLLDDTSSFFNYDNLKQFILPVIFTIAYIPSIYLIALYSSYESLFIRIDFFLKNSKKRNEIKIACFRRCLFSVNMISKLTPYLVRNLAISTSQKKALKLVSHFKVGSAE